MVFLNQLHTGDCLIHLETLYQQHGACVDLAFADPPFNIGYGYDVYDDDQSREAYLDWTTKWIAAVKRVLKPNASFWVAIGDEYAAELKIRLDQAGEGELGLTMRNWVIWHYTFGVRCSRKFSRSHAHLLYYVVNPKRLTFNGDAIRVPSARQTTYNDKRANAGGKVPDDTWVLRPQEEAKAFKETDGTWYLPRVCGTFKERLKTGASELGAKEENAKTAHPCQMPESVLERIIRVSSNPGDVVLDPFAGSGTTLAVAKKLSRRWVGMELSEEYTRTIRERLGVEEIS